MENISETNKDINNKDINTNSRKNGVKIVAFLCNWCSYAGADSAGTSRLRQPEDIRIIRVPCSGRINPLFVLKALTQGADGVLVSGCHPNDCHYSDGNFYARRRLEILKEFLPVIGIDERRFSYQWVSASEGQKWQKVVINFVKRIREIQG
ncbi:MAG TPA: hydrogenase iron-sulfur subunit [Candidatus Humimicrobiaceae bacterium]|jgi:coenzyme F420-reducing hydrogenase delta subunit